MSECFKAITRFVELLKSSKLSPWTNDMLEYHLYQLNLAKLREERSGKGSSEFPCNSREIIKLNGLIHAAGREDYSEVAGKELMDRLSQIIGRMNVKIEERGSEKVRRTH